MSNFNYSNSKWNQIGETIQGEAAADGGFSLSISDNSRYLWSTRNDANGDVKDISGSMGTGGGESNWL